MSFHYDPHFSKVYLNLTGVATHNVELGESASGNLTRIENAIEGIPARLQEAQEKLENLHGQVRAAEEELGKEFSHALKLREKNARLSELNVLLSMDKGKGGDPKAALIDAAKRCLGGGKSLVTDAVPGRRYVGDIIGISETHVVQRIAPTMGIIHNRSLLNGLEAEAEESSARLRIVYDRTGRVAAVERRGYSDRKSVV